MVSRSALYNEKKYEHSDCQGVTLSIHEGIGGGPHYSDPLTPVPVRSSVEAPQVPAVWKTWIHMVLHPSEVIGDYL